MDKDKDTQCLHCWSSGPSCIRYIWPLFASEGRLFQFDAIILVAPFLVFHCRRLMHNYWYVLICASTSTTANKKKSTHHHIYIHISVILIILCAWRMLKCQYLNYIKYGRWSACARARARLNTHAHTRIRAQSAHKLKRECKWSHRNRNIHLFAGNCNCRLCRIAFASVTTSTSTHNHQIIINTDKEKIPSKLNGYILLYWCVQHTTKPMWMCQRSTTNREAKKRSLAGRSGWLHLRLHLHLHQSSKMHAI